jgi:hypothetical protein
MGYYTDYSLKVYFNENISHLSKEKLVEAKANLELVDRIVRDQIHELYPHALVEQVKWYDHREDMLRLSKKYPDFVFELEGHGEDEDDHWRLYFHHGQVSGGKAKMVYPENPFLVSSPLEVKK